MIECTTKDVSASAEDLISIRQDGSVQVLRRFKFHTDSDEPSSFRFFRREAIGKLERPPIGELKGADQEALALYDARDATDGFVWELNTVVSASEDVTVELLVDIVSANYVSPLNYSVKFASLQGISYSFVLRPWLAELTLPTRFQWSAEPDSLTERVMRADDSGCLSMQGVIRVSQRTGKVLLTFEHGGEDFAVTRLLSYYQKRFSGDA